MIKNMMHSLKNELGDKTQNTSLIFLIVLFSVCSVMFIWTIFSFLNRQHIKLDQLTVNNPQIYQKNNNYKALLLDVADDASLYLQYSDKERNVTLAKVIDKLYLTINNAHILKETTMSDLQVPNSEEFEPTILIKALLVMNKRGMAILTIEGEPENKIYKSGDVFSQGRGKIISIDEKGVMWSWKNVKKHTIAY